MTEHAFPRRNAAVIPAFRIDTIEAEGLQPAGVVLIADGADHAPVFVVVVAAHGGGKNDDRHPRVPVRQQLHGSLQMGTVFFNDTATPEIYTLSLHDALPI